MTKGVLTISLWLIHLFLSAQQPLIGIKNGSWIIFQDNERTQLPKDYYDVGNFDQSGFAFFAKNGNYGILDATGKEVLQPQYMRMESFGYGFFGGVSEEANYLIHIRDSVTIDTCLSWDKIAAQWSIINSKGKTELLNFPSANYFETDSSTILDNHGFGYISLKTPSGQRVFNRHGKEITLGNGFTDFHDDYLRIKHQQGDRLILKNQTLELPDSVDKFYYDGTFFQYSTPERTVRMNVFGEVQMDVPYSDLSNAGLNRFVFEDQGRSGVMDGDGNVLISPLYFNIRPTKEGYFVRTDDGLGLVSGTGEELVPAQFKRITRSGDFYIVSSKAELFGVFSPRKEALIVPAKFKKIGISDDKIRGWLNDILQISFYDSTHTITQTITLDNTVSRYTNASSLAGLDKRLFSVGWFVEETPVFDSEGFRTGTQQKWGIRNEIDSVIAKARFRQPRFVPSANFSMLPLGKKDVEFMRSPMKEKQLFNAIDLKTGNVMPGEFLEIDTTDALTRDYLRFSSANGFGYITRDNEVHKVMHFDRENDKFLRFTTSQTYAYRMAEEDEREAIRLSSFKLNSYSNIEYQTWRFRSVNYTQVILEDAKWNFLRPSGTPLFQESFDFADRFFLNTAIVRRGSKWGAVNQDSVVVPIAFSSVERLPEFHDTVFLVSKQQNGFVYLDKKSNVLDHKITRILKNKANYVIAQVGRNQIVLNNNYEVVSPEAGNFRSLNDDYLAFRQNRLTVVQKFDGTILAEVDANPRDVFFDEFLLCRDGSIYGLLNSVGDTILPFDFKSIEQWGDMILAKGKGNVVLNDLGERIYTSSSKTVLVDSVTNFIADVDGDKVLIYDQKGEKVTKVSKISPDLFINGVLIQLGSYSVAKAIDDRELDLPERIKSVEAAGNSGYILDTRNGFKIRDLNWKQYSTVLPNAEWDKARYLGEGVILLKTNKQHFLSANYGYHEVRGRTVKEFNSGLILCTSRGKFWYSTPTGDDPFNREFRDAAPFKDGFGAAKFRRGWAILDANGRPKSLDSYGEITVHGNGIFSTASASLYGLIDHHGEVILEANYERLEILHGSVIQAVKNGEIFYFKLDGTPIHY